MKRYAIYTEMYELTMNGILLAPRGERRQNRK